MIHIDIITVEPELLKGPFAASIMKRAIDKGKANICFHNLRAYGLNRYKQVDDYQYGGGAGMVLMCEPLDKLITELKAKYTYDEVIYVTPDGPTFTQKIANRMSSLSHLLIVCGHYKGIDERIRQLHITQEISIGDYVLSGGELAAAVISDAIIRLIPGVLNDETSALSDSFQDNLLSPPVYTRPAEYKGLKVPEILLSGNFPKIDQWRYEEAIKRTKNRRPDLLKE